MITIRTQYIFYLILYSQLVFASNINITFEIFHASNEYKNIATQKVYELNKKGFNCYIKPKNKQLFLRCNDSNTTQQMQKNIKKFNKYNISFSIIDLTQQSQTKKLKENTLLAYGYKLYNLKQYTKALDIFQKLYQKNQNAQVAYAYALTLMKKHKYQRAIKILQPYNNQKSKKLLNDIINNYFYYTLNNYNFKNAKKILKKYNLKNKEQEFYILFALSLQKKYQYQKALTVLEPYIQNFPKAKKTYFDILYNKYIYDGWGKLHENPQTALSNFKNACKIKKKYDCFNGMMFAYFNMKKYKPTLYLATKLYPYKPNDKTATIAMDSSLLLHQYQTAQNWYKKIHNKKGIKNPYLSEQLFTLTTLIKQKDYSSAQKEISNLLKQYPTNQDILVKQMELYIRQQQYKNAKNTANTILKKYPSSPEALYTMALLSFINQNYHQCYSFLKLTPLSQEYQKDLFHQCNAYQFLKEYHINNAKAEISKIKNKALLYSFYIDLAKFFDKKEDTKNSFLALKQAKKNISTIEDFINYLYYLKGTKKYDLLEKEIQIGYKLFPKDHQKINTFRLVYHKERLYHFYKTEQYKECLEYADSTLKYAYHDSDILRLHGWCAYFRDDYLKAQEQFQKLIRTKHTQEDIFAYALSSYKLGEVQNAENILNKLSIDKLNSSQKIALANLYTNLHYQHKAENILHNTNVSTERDKTLKNIQNSYTQLYYENSLSIGGFWQSQKGTEGKNRLLLYSVPVDYDYYNHQIHFYTDLDFIYLYNGSLKSSDYINFGFGTTTQNNTIQNDKGIFPKVGLDYKNYHIMLGSTPIGTKISPEPIWLLSTYIQKNKWLTTFKIEQKELDETMLSFVGEKAQEKNKKAYWGRVVKRGASIGLNYNSFINLSFNFSYFFDIYGQNVASNSEKKFTFVALYSPYTNIFKYLQIGTLGIYDSYNTNQNLFTYGNGGYFSPQKFYMFGIFTQFADNITQKLYYQSKLAIGFENYTVDDTQEFPLHDKNINIYRTVTGYNENGFDYQVALQLGYKINTQFDILSGLSFESFNSYSINNFSLALVYRFDKRKENDFNTFYLNHRINQIIPRYEIAK